MQFCGIWLGHCAIIERFETITSEGPWPYAMQDAMLAQSYTPSSMVHFDQFDNAFIRLSFAYPEVQAMFKHRSCLMMKMRSSGESVFQYEALGFAYNASTFRAW